MKTVTNITLGGIVFAIEDGAYQSLSLYLESIEKKFVDSEDFAEISEDIEQAIAEKFIAQGKNEKRAVDLGDVKTIMSELGTAEEVVGENTSSHEPKESELNQVRKRLYRNKDDAVIAGVASGIAEYFGIDPVIVRVIFFIGIFINGIGIVAYLILWLIVPMANTTAEKYAMRGQRITVTKITERVKKNLNSLEEVDLTKASSLWQSIRSILVKIFTLFGTLVQLFIGSFRYVFGTIFVAGGALLIAGLITTYSVVILSDKVLMPNEVQTALEIILNNPIGILAVSASFVVMLIPALVLIMIGGSLFTKRNLFTLSKSISLSVVFIVAVVLAFTASLLQVEKVMQKIGPTAKGGNYDIHININDRGIRLE